MKKLNAGDMLFLCSGIGLVGVLLMEDALGLWAALGGLLVVIVAIIVYFIGLFIIGHQQDE